MRKPKVHWESNLARGDKDNKKGVFNYVNNKRKTGKNIGLLLNEIKLLVTEDTEKTNTEYLLCFSLLRLPLGNGRSWSKVRQSGERKASPWLQKNLSEII